LQERNLDLEFRNLDKDRLTIAGLDALIGDRNYREFLNPRNELFRERKMKEHPPSRSEALKLMAAEPNLIRRPIVILGKQVILGYDEKALKKLR
jgi:arsenate reductase